MKVGFTDEAEASLEIIADFIALDNADRAVSFVKALRDQALNIGTFPEAFPIVGRYENDQVRRGVFGNYLIFYRILAGQVQVLQVVHGATSPSSWRFSS